MKCNVGGIDKALRMIAGITIIGAGIFYLSWWGAVGIISLGTALIGFCPFYLLPGGISTCQKEG